MSSINTSYDNNLAQTQLAQQNAGLHNMPGSSSFQPQFLNPSNQDFGSGGAGSGTAQAIQQLGQVVQMLVQLVTQLVSALFSGNSGGADTGAAAPAGDAAAGVTQPADAGSVGTVAANDPASSGTPTCRTDASISKASDENSSGSGNKLERGLTTMKKAWDVIKEKGASWWNKAVTFVDNFSKIF